MCSSRWAPPGDMLARVHRGVDRRRRSRRRDPCVSAERVVVGAASTEPPTFAGGEAPGDHVLLASTEPPAFVGGEEDLPCELRPRHVASTEPPTGAGGEIAPTDAASLATLLLQ